MIELILIFSVPVLVFIGTWDFWVRLWKGKVHFYD